jgi:homoserine O-acetyltransferase/O-succinyltransferase
MDYFEPFAEEVASAPSTDILLVSFDSDWRFGTEHSRYIAGELRALGAEPEHVEIASPWGHDSFLMEVPVYHATVARLLNR